MSAPSRLSSCRRLAGFTLVELLVVILVLGILLAIALPLLLHAQDSAKQSQVKTDLNSSYKAAKLYASSNEGSFTGFGEGNPATAPASDGGATVTSADGGDLVLTKSSTDGSQTCTLTVVNRAAPAYDCSSGGGEGPLSVYDEAVLAGNPLVYWRLDSTGTIADTSGNGLTGSVFGTSPTLTNPLTTGGGRAYLFGPDVLGGVTSSSALDLDRPDWTLEYWMTYSGTCSGGPPTVWLDRNNNAWEPVAFMNLDCNSNLLGVFGLVEGGSNAFGPEFLALTQTDKHHIVLRFNEGATEKTVSVFIDGQKAFETTYQTALRKGTTSIHIGGQMPYWGGWAGYRPNITMDDFAVYPSALSDTDIASHYSLGS